MCVLPRLFGLIGPPLGVPWEFESIFFVFLAQFITFLLKKTRKLDQIAIETVNFHTKCFFYVPNS